jgi:type III restriction enzyme
VFKELNGKTTNLHTNLKGKVKWIGGRKNGYPVFEESESDISDDDLKALRELSRQIDSDQNPYTCIVSVLMLREGWDVRNVTTIVPLRPFTSKANILPEQTLGRGLRRMTPPGEAAELVTVIEHPAFVSLYAEELEQEGLFIETIDVDHIPKTTVTIFPDKEHKDFKALDIVLPEVSGGFSRMASLEGLTIEDVRKQFKKYKPLPVGKIRSEEIHYEGRHLITNELVESMKIRLPLLENGMGAVSFYREELERICGLRGTHPVLAPLLETFLTEILFEEKLTLFDQRLLSRIGEADVREHVRATFVPLILKRTTIKEERKAASAGKSVSLWKPFQVTHSAHRPAVPAKRTLFNLAPCNRDLEVAMSQFLDRAPDVVAFCKNAGPQSLRVDYLSGNGQLAFYTPDFLARLDDGNYALVETKGRVDRDVPLKARAAVAWCKAASKAKMKWFYLYVPQQTFEAFGDNRLDVLARSCEPALQDLIEEAQVPQLTLAFGEVRDDETELFISKADFTALPPTHQKMVQQAIGLFQFLEKKSGQSFAPVFTPLLGPLDEASKAVLLKRLGPEIPTEREAQKIFFETNISGLTEKEIDDYKRRSSNLKRTLVDHNGMSPIGLLRECLQYARDSKKPVAPVFDCIKKEFQTDSEDIFKLVSRINSFRNTYVAHQTKELTDLAMAKTALAEWTSGLRRIWKLR